MSTPERPTPPFDADERTTLAGWLDFYRATLVAKCVGPTEEQLREAAVPPSSLTLLGLVRHAAEVERNWFRRVLLGEDVPPIYDSPSTTEGHDGGFDLSDGLTFDVALENWEAEVARARAACADLPLDHSVPFHGTRITLRWIHTHLIAEYARHNGHADLIRETLDGTTGF